MASGDARISVTFDQCNEDGSVACMLAFIGGRHARTWHTRPPAERQGLIVDRLAAWFGPEAREVLAYAEQDWTEEPYSGGGPIALFIEVR